MSLILSQMNTFLDPQNLGSKSLAKGSSKSEAPCEGLYKLGLEVLAAEARRSRDNLGCVE